MGACGTAVANARLMLAASVARRSEDFILVTSLEEIEKLEKVKTVQEGRLSVNDLEVRS